MKTPEQDRADYEARCTHKRIGHRVCKVDGTLEFDGSDPKRGIIGINAAKRYVRTNNLKSFTVH